jgi:poly-gamma-glutamate synthesis protein (capsule biosynthesis protein)
MSEAVTLDWLKKLNVFAVSLANNHTHDRGDKGWLWTRDQLEKNDIVVIGDGEVHDFGEFHLAAFTDLSNQLAPHRKRLGPEQIKSALPDKMTTPLFCFLHWGQEWRALPGDREEALTRLLFDEGVSVIVGSHPHTATTGVESFRGGRCARVYSMGNLLFDQRDPRASGGLVEARFFATGTYALRWIPFGNLYEKPSP